MMASHYSEAPFPETIAINTERLAAPRHPSLQTYSPTSALPSPLNNPSETRPHVPGEPTVNLVPGEVYSFLARELDTPILDELYTRLWLVARKSGKSIDPLNRQRVKRREIVFTEDPKLHLVWHHDRIYLKPIPICLLNYQFWTAYLASSADTRYSCTNGSQAKFHRSVALGFLRSYAFLIQHHTDLILAREHHLIPEDTDWIKWSTFIAYFRNIEDHQVANRYHYGQLRLSRLNWAIRIFRPQSTNTAWFYEIPHWSTGLYMERAIAPLIFAFASLSIILSSMQVALSAPADGLGFAQLDTSGLQVIRRAFWVFSIIVLFLLGAVWMLLLVIPSSVVCWQLSWGFRNRRNTVFGRAIEPEA